jgi:hypothetical protein
MAAWKTITRLVDEMCHQFGPRPREHQLKRTTQQRAAAHRRQHEQRRRALVIQHQKAAHAERDDGEHGRAAERGDIAHHGFYPSRADRVGKVGRVAQSTQQRFIEDARSLLPHPRRQRDEGQQGGSA